MNHLQLCQTKKLHSPDEDDYFDLFTQLECAVKMKIIKNMKLTKITDYFPQ